MMKLDLWRGGSVLCALLGAALLLGGPAVAVEAIDAADPLLIKAATLAPQSGEGVDIRTAFNQNVDRVRLMVLLSPTWPGCIHGARVVHDSVLKQVESNDLSVLAVWMPVLGSDNAEEGKKAEPLLADPRVTHYWDADKSLGNLYGRQLTLPRGRQLAWDIYFVYAPGVRWEDAPPAPTAWMHQLDLDERHLDGDTLRGTILKLLSTEEAVK